MDGVKVTGTFKADVWYKVAALLAAKKYGVETTLKSCEKAEEWTSIVHRVQRKTERDSA